MKKIHIKNDSGDRKYFTIIPNYILNHSTLWDREVYIQMKRITGEDGTCWTSQKTLASQCGISINRLKKSLKYLIDHKWIYSLGKKQVQTKGGPQEVNEYRIADLWKMNVDYYEAKGVSPETIPLSEISQRGITAEAKGVSPGDDKEELREEEHKTAILRIAEKKKVDLFIDSFKEISPMTYKDWFGNKTQRKAAESLIKNVSPEILTFLIDRALPKLNILPYVPSNSKAFSPYELSKNIDRIKAKIKEIGVKVEKEKSKVATIIT